MRTLVHVVWTSSGSTIQCFAWCVGSRVQASIFETTKRTLGYSEDEPKERMLRFPRQTMFLPVLYLFSFCHRCKLSASPATGLVGMEENGFLCDFFGCVGFLPLATHRCRELRCCSHVMRSIS